MKKNLLSLFSGCGGMDIGFEGSFKIIKCQINKSICNQWIESEDENYYTLKETIFETKFANDINKYAKIAWDNYFNNRKSNFNKNIYKLGSIVDYVKEYENGNKKIFPEQIDIITGGFPCQDFSVAGKRRGFNSHKDHNGSIINDNIPNEETRGKLYIWMKNVIQITLPKIFIAENVKGLANLGDVKSIIQSDFSKINGESYIVLPPKVLHAGEYGVSQSRERIFFIGFKKSALTDEAIKTLTSGNIPEDMSPYPSSTHKINNKIYYSNRAHYLLPFVKSKDVLKDLLEPHDSSDLSQISYSKAKFMGGHCQGQKEIDLNNLAPTIRSEHHGNIEFRRLSIQNGGKYKEEILRGFTERRLTLRECARIQTFPDDFDFVIKNSNGKFDISPSEAYRLVGNAVPPLLAYHIAKKIESNWNYYFGNY